MKRVNVLAAGLGWRDLERRGVNRIAGIGFAPQDSVFPAVTCVAQATLRTGLEPSRHGMVSNGWWSDVLKKPIFWEQSAGLVKGSRVWDERRLAGWKVGMYFFQQSLGEKVDSLISPAPIHKHGGGMVMSCYTKPAGMTTRLERLLGKFPLWRYWGPLASPKVGRRCIDWFEAATEIEDVDEAYLYLPTLDYAAQKFGPESRQAAAAFDEFKRQLSRIVAMCEQRGCALSVLGDYAITPVTVPPCQPNVALRKAGLFRTRDVGGRAYPDFYQSEAFAMCDHEFCIVRGDKSQEAAKMLVATGFYEFAEDCGVPNLLLARNGSWCAYEWWTNPREAPDFANHVDIHNKPGYDPKELFFFNRGTVKGTHGRRCLVAASL